MRLVGGEADTTDSDPSAALVVLEHTVRNAPDPSGRRVIAAADSHSVDEGLALLECYVGIKDRRVRQAILDVLVAASGKRYA